MKLRFFCIWFCILIASTTIAESAEWRFFDASGQLERIKKTGNLTVITQNNPAVFYKSKDGIAGLEYDLVSLFAKHLGVKVKFITVNTLEEILNGISKGKADIAAAGLIVTKQRRKTMRFAPAYMEVDQQLIYHSRAKKPKNIQDLSKGILEIQQGMSAVRILKKHKRKFPGLHWLTNAKLDTQGLLYMVKSGLIDYTIADSNQISTIRRFYPKLSIAFNIASKQPVAWALSKSKDKSLYNEIIRFFSKIKSNKQLVQLLEKHYGHINQFDYVSLCKFRQHKKLRLPNYQALFEQAAKQYKLDWRLLAAMAYQESHWLEQATSPTGVKGLMMLTKGTARYLGVKNRTDPEQSINGGAKYFHQRLKKIPDRIMDPERTWMALAAYNVGYGHLEDARVLTQKRGGNPDKWVDVKKNLPLLSQKKWYLQTKHGRARGNEPVKYVDNIRNYYDLLVWLTEGDTTDKDIMMLEEKIHKQDNPAMQIRSPVI